MAVYRHAKRTVSALASKSPEPVASSSLLGRLSFRLGACRWHAEEPVRNRERIIVILTQTGIAMCCRPGCQRRDDMTL